MKDKATLNLKERSSCRIKKGEKVKQTVNEVVIPLSHDEKIPAVSTDI